MKRIEDFAFKFCGNLKEIHIPESVERVGEDAFYGCWSLPIIDGGKYADKYMIHADYNN